MTTRFATGACDIVRASSDFVVALLARDAKSGQNLARMRYEIVLAPEAVEDLQSLKANLRAEVRDAIERHLRHRPNKTRKSRIKGLRGLSRVQYRLRVGDDVRVFYDVIEETVEVLAIVPKSKLTNGSKNTV